jgi:hypothetical protein
MLPDFSRNGKNPGIVYLIAFTDEATFHISGHVKRHNTIFWGTENPRVIPEHERASVKVNAWCAVTAAGVIRPYFFDTPTVNSESYLHMLQSYVINKLPIIIRSAAYLQTGRCTCAFWSYCSWFPRWHISTKMDRKMWAFAMASPAPFSDALRLLVVGYSERESVQHGSSEYQWTQGKNCECGNIYSQRILRQGVKRYFKSFPIVCL